MNFEKHVLNNGVFSIQYGKYNFMGTLDEFRIQCKNFIDYVHHNNNYFDCAIHPLGKEIPVSRGFKQVLSNAIK